MSHKKITVPFIYTHPFLEKTIYPLKGSIWFGYFMFLAVQCVVIYEDMADELFSLSIYFWFSIFGLLLVLFINFILDKFIYDHIAIANSQLIYFNSKLLSGNQKQFGIGPESKIVWAIEKGSYSRKQHSLYLVDSKNDKHILIDKLQTYMWNNILENFLKKLSKLTGLKVSIQGNDT